LEPSIYNFLVAILMASTDFNKVKYPSQGCVYQRCEKENCISVVSLLLFIQLNTQLDCSRKFLNLTLKFTLKGLYMFRFNYHLQGTYSRA